MRQGWKTTEFWGTVSVAVGTVAAAAAGVLPPRWAALAAAVAAGAYSIGRGLAKSGAAGGNP